MRILLIFLKGNDIQYNAVRKDCIDQIMVFLDPALGQHRSVHLARLLLEIIRNIYDHAEGRGQVCLKDDGHTIHFEIKDYGQKAYDLEEIIRIGVSSKAGNGKNFGVGLIKGAIRGFATDLRIELKIDTSCGFKYQGTYAYRPSE